MLKLCYFSLFLEQPLLEQFRKKMMLKKENCESRVWRISALKFPTGSESPQTQTKNAPSSLIRCSFFSKVKKNKKNKKKLFVCQIACLSLKLKIVKLELKSP